ncbi:hypothetical protein TVAG_383880 [Trichomonas vaginalis G3]|uniref:Uncharacterized protein n=1 Tax=Trichomonas vaginalis (strain ATCC PRA-98 / G3) TaxID=412133 RepID=A2F087_TRIV3|nr:hypothetical protein TVAG_383880 [Trichomonas vaginalis G3]|eukprot:XP_001314242.1 hypothetical protein [Trichomonas vaginalis G3]
MERRTQLLVNGGVYVVDIDLVAQSCGLIRKARKKLKGDEPLVLKEICDSKYFRIFIELAQNNPQTIKDTYLFELALIAQKMEANQLQEAFKYAIIKKFTLDKILEEFVRQIISNIKCKVMIDIISMNFPRLVQRNSIKYIDPDILFEIFSSPDFVYPPITILNEFIKQSYNIYKQKTLILKPFIRYDNTNNHDSEISKIFKEIDETHKIKEHSILYSKQKEEEFTQTQRDDLQKHMHENDIELVTKFNQCKTGEIKSSVFEEFSHDDGSVTEETVMQKKKELQQNMRGQTFQQYENELNNLRQSNNDKQKQYKELEERKNIFNQIKTLEEELKQYEETEENNQKNLQSSELELKSLQSENKS